MSNIPDFDDSKYRLGKLCTKQHDFWNGYSLRYKGNCRNCVFCLKERTRSITRAKSEREIFLFKTTPFYQKGREVTLNDIAFIKSVDVKGQDDCWEWKGSKVGMGYGKFSVNNRTQRSHRIAWIKSHGEIPDNLWVLHKCDNPPCCNPSHLFLGTVRDNVLDMFRKGRQGTEKMKASKIGKNLKLNRQQVQLIFELARKGVSQKEIANTMGVSDWLIRKVQRHNYFK